MPAGFFSTDPKSAEAPRRLPFLIPMAAALLLATASYAQTGAESKRARAGGPSNHEQEMAAWAEHQKLDEASLFRGLEWRSIGPVIQGGRVIDIEAIPGQPYGFLVAYASGGLWRTVDNGVNFEPIFDDQPTLIMGDVAIDPQNPERLWVGTGEDNSSRSSYGGVGIFRSDDGGESWRHVGLGESDRIGRIAVDPRDGDRVYVGSLGKLYTPGGQRGVFRTTDGGESWQHVLDTGKLETGEEGWTGVVDLMIDPHDPDTLYAAAWHRERSPWNFVEGGEGSGVYKSTDGGDTWKLLEGGGLPAGEHVGRIGLAAAPSSPGVLYATVDNQEELPEELRDAGGSPLSAARLRADGGMSEEEFLSFDADTLEGFIRANDLDTDLDAEKLIDLMQKGEVTVADLIDELSDANANLFNTDIRGLEVYRSEDGGATWRRTHEKPLRDVVYTYGYYFGQVRVDPRNAERLFIGGVPLITSEDGGKTWSGANQRDVHVDYQAGWIDPENPQRMWIGNDGGIDASYDGGKTWVRIDNQSVGQFYTVEVDMEEPYNVYGGLQDNGTLTGSSRSRPGVDRWRVIGGGDGMHIEVDPRDGLLYTGFQFGYYFRSDGQEVRPRDALKEPALRYNWQTPIRLSSHNPDILYFGANRLFRSMDRGESWTAISPDLTRSQERGDVPFATLTTLSESELHFGLLWVGTDDGQIWLTPDGGASWSDSGRDLPADRWVSRVEASRHVKERAYLTLNGYRQDDNTAYAYVTEDLGKTWKSIAAGLPAEPLNVIREDPVNADVLYVGSDRGVYVSLDRGSSWQGLPAGLPNVPVHDLVVHPRDRELVAGTHGRSIYVIDALPIQDLAEARDEPAHLFPVENVAYSRAWQGRRSLWFADLEDPPALEIPFWSAREGSAVLRVEDEESRTLRRLELEVHRGVNTATWDLLLDPDLARSAEEEALAEAASDDEAEEADKVDEAADSQLKVA
ncbi:MAG: glycosyl hydrolase, partial [Acidobacteriota bacterium]